MNDLQAFARLNLVLELVSECAGLADADAVCRAVGARLPWILDFDRCTLALRIGGELRWAEMTRGAEGPLQLAAESVPLSCKALIDEAMSAGAPICQGVPMEAVAHPLGEPGRQMGALSVERRSAPYTYRDLRLIHHICTSLGVVLTRMEHQEAIDAHQREMREVALLAERDRAARAEAATQANDTFLAMLGHELRNPLAPILSAVELLRQKAAGSPTPEVDMVERQARHLDRLVSDLLDVSRVTTGRVSLRRSTVDLSVVVARAVEMARPLIERKGQVLSIELPAKPILVFGDEARLCQVISNLLNNASIYSESDLCVKIIVEEVAGEAMISVIDEGIGIAPEMLDKIFGLFVQGGRSKELAPGGLGLGLGVARSLVELHGGRIEACSSGEGCGSRFTVVLPVLIGGTAPEEPVPKPTEARLGRGPARRVLLVDDNVDSADSMGELARSAGHNVVVAYGPEQALAAVAEFRPHVALLDIGLPTMDGYQLGLELRRRLGDAPLTLIALSGYGQERDRQLSRAHGFAAHLVKPADISEVLKLIACAEGQGVRVSRSTS